MLLITVFVIAFGVILVAIVAIPSTVSQELLTIEPPIEPPAALDEPSLPSTRQPVPVINTIFVMTGVAIGVFIMHRRRYTSGKVHVIPESAVVSTEGAGDGDAAADADAEREVDNVKVVEKIVEKVKVVVEFRDNDFMKSRQVKRNNPGPGVLATEPPVIKGSGLPRVAKVDLDLDWDVPTIGDDAAIPEPSDDGYNEFINEPVDEPKNRKIGHWNPSTRT
jgi:hypothetical protein